jgi:hypothetical protein
LVVLFAWAPRASFSETPGEIPKPWTYEGSMKLQEQQRQQDQQPQQAPQTRQNAGNAAPGGAGAAAVEAARRSWQQKPPLPPDRNPLLGRWRRPPTGQANSSDPFAALQALAKGGLCEVLFGGGTFEFRPTTLVGFDARTSEQELDKVEYRGGEKQVAVLPKTTVRLMVFDFDGPDRINWSGQNCVLVRVGASNGAAAPAPATVARPAAAASPGTSVGGVLSLSVTSPSQNSSALAGRALWVLKDDAQVALTKGGLQSTPNGTALQNWIRACQSRTPACQQGALALKPYAVGVATTDASGHVQTPPLPPGRYWVLSDAKVDNRRMMWNEPVEVKAGSTSLTLDQRNAKPVD